MNFKIENGIADLDYAGTVRISEISFIIKKEETESYLFKPSKKTYKIIYCLKSCVNYFYAGFGEDEKERDRVYDMIVKEMAKSN